MIMGKYDKEIEKVFSYIRNLETTYCPPEELGSLYQQLYATTIPGIDAENLCQKLSTLLMLEDIKDIKVEIKRLMKTYSYDMIQTEQCLKIVECLAMSIKHLAINELSIDLNNFIDIAYKKQAEKNAYYGDIWYKRGLIGVCRDMGRKIVRFKNFNLMVTENPEDVLDNLIDLLNYCVFYIVLVWEENNVSRKG